jgi:hypothetical protein
MPGTVIKIQRFGGVPPARTRLSGSASERQERDREETPRALHCAPAGPGVEMGRLSP